jgi:hypothetical protein
MLGIRYHRDGAVLERNVDETVAVSVLAVDGYEQPTRLDPPRVVV